LPLSGSHALASRGFFIAHVWLSVIVHIVYGQKLTSCVSCVSHAAQFDLRFRDSASQLAKFGIGVYPRNFMRERFHFLGQDRIGINRQAQTAAARVSCRADAPMRSFWPGASLSILAVGLGFGVARQAASSRLSRVVSTT
jgi:hypothetical protein